MAKHFIHYLNLLRVPYLQWSRNQPDTLLNDLVNQCSPIVLLINDDAIESFIEKHDFLTTKILVHFSGNLYTTLAYGAHPLLSFSDQFYALETYQKIPFICDEKAPAFQILLPGLTNPHFTIPSHLKSFYHALCVMSGNFTTLLWQKFFNEFETTFHIPKQQAYPFFEQIMQNLLIDNKKALTGPLVRNDQQTIESHLNSLTNDPFQPVYQAFLQAFRATNHSSNKV